LCSCVAARIVGLAGPEVISPNANITVSLITENYIQSVADISVAFSLSPAVYRGYLGPLLLGSFYLGSARSNVLNNVNFTVQTPSDLSDVHYINAAVTSLYGASHVPITMIWNLRVDVGNATSTALGTTVDGLNVCKFETQSPASLRMYDSSGAVAYC
jgi:hypothetical protein